MIDIKPKFEVGEMVTCSPKNHCIRVRTTNSDWPGGGWKREKTFQIARITDLDRPDPILWPENGDGIYSSAVKYGNGWDNEINNSILKEV